MIGYIVRRLIQAILVMFMVTLAVFIMFQLLPGGEARAVLGPRATPASIAAFNHANLLDQPWWVRFWHYISGLIPIGLPGSAYPVGQFHAPDFGFSYSANQSVWSLLSVALPKTLLLMGLSYAVAIIVAVPLGIYQAVRRNKVDDYVLTGASFVFYSMPVFWLGILLIVLFSATLRVLPSEGPQFQNGDFVSQLPNLILPVATLALVTIALFSRYMRSSVLENMVQDYVRTARAKGASSRRVLFMHVLRNALIPILTLIGLSVSFIFSGALLTEALFNYQGMGLLFWNSAIGRDYPVILGVIEITGLATVLGSLLADILYAVADPRVRYTK